MTCELVDRICFQSDWWDTGAAYGLVRRMKESGLSDCHPNALACVLKYLSEAVILGARPPE